jgi:uncharacterized iron-regulated membrane protein
MNQNLDMTGWKSYLFWEGIPFWLPLSVFGFISVLNWGYESKLITPDDGASSWTSVHLGLVLLGIAFVMALVAGFLLFLVRVIASRIAKPELNVSFRFVSLIVIAILLIVPGLFIVVLGPSSITMMEQARAR